MISILCDVNDDNADHDAGDGDDDIDDNDVAVLNNDCDGNFFDALSLTC